jgi:hypothetical protein
VSFFGKIFSSSEGKKSGGMVSTALRFSSDAFSEESEVGVATFVEVICCVAFKTDCAVVASTGFCSSSGTLAADKTAVNKRNRAFYQLSFTLQSLIRKAKLKFGLERKYSKL